jgi:type VI secretion system secreted protein VgrG
VNISFYASGDAEFNTGGVLHLNNGGGPGATPDGQGVKASIDANINAAFPKPKG